MKIAVLKEVANETRVAITPQSVKSYIKLGFQVTIETNAGRCALFHDEAYIAAGASIASSSAAALKDCALLLSVTPPEKRKITKIPTDSIIITALETTTTSPFIDFCIKHPISLFSMTYIPRISRAQNMDVLSSQASLSGYRAVLEALHYYKKAAPLMMTAAGVIHPANVLILGAGVAGLQAIATAKRLGAVVFVFDVRKAAKEQVESLGAKFVEVSDESFESNSGYASETSEAYRQLQANLIATHAKEADMIITTALIPDKSAPLLLTKETILQMKPGAVIVDLATSKGGNCELSAEDKVIQQGDITIIGYSAIARLIPTSASEMYANNLLNFVKHLCPDATHIQFNNEDPIIAKTLITHQGINFPFKEKTA